MGSDRIVIVGGGPAGLAAAPAHEDGWAGAYAERVLCTGSDPVRPPFEGADLPGVHVILGRLGRPRRRGPRAAGWPLSGRGSSAARPPPRSRWGEALAQGEVAGRAIAGEDARWEAVPGFWSTIGLRTMKRRGWDDVRVDSDATGFTACYGRGGRVVVGVLTHERDRDDERGGELVAAGAPFPAGSVPSRR